MEHEDWEEYLARERRKAARIMTRVRRRERWQSTSRATVRHPRYGTVVVPHISNLTAVQNAAELWGVSACEVFGASVTAWEPADGPVTVPEEFRSEPGEDPAST